MSSRADVELRKILEERAKEKAKFPTKEERIRETERKQRILATLERQEQARIRQARIKQPEFITPPKREITPELAEQLAAQQIQQTVSGLGQPGFILPPTPPTPEEFVNQTFTEFSESEKQRLIAFLITRQQLGQFNIIPQIRQQRAE